VSVEGPKQPDVLAAMQENLRRRFFEEGAAREKLELEAMQNNPESIPYGRHSAESVKEVHYLRPGGEYVGRHRRICSMCDEDITDDQVYAVLWNENTIHVLCPRWTRDYGLQPPTVEGS